MLLAPVFDVVLLDYDLPDGKGIELMETINAAGMPIIAVSSRAENNARLLAAGAITAVSKMQFHRIGQALSGIMLKSDR